MTSAITYHTISSTGHKEWNLYIHTAMYLLSQPQIKYKHYNYYILTLKVNVGVKSESCL